MANGQGLEVLHVDMDAFYAAVEVRADPSLGGRPVIVGGTGSRGVVASCSYEARAYGVRSAMPSRRARSLCPDAVFLAGHYDAYSEVSQQLHRILNSFTPLVEGIALDEAFLDVSGVHRLFGSTVEIAKRIRTVVNQELGLACSVGVARSKLIAKLASRMAKPTATRAGTIPGPGVVVVEADTEQAFLQPLPVTAIWGVGPATAERLARLGVVTVGHLAALPMASLVSALGPAHGRSLYDLSHGRDQRPVVPDRAVKSVGHEETYAVDDHRHDSLRRQVVRMGDAVASRLRDAGLGGRTVTLKVRFADFSTITRSRTLAAPIDTARDITQIGWALLDPIDVSVGVRLLGVSVSYLVTAGPALPRQLSLDELGEAGPGGHRGPGHPPPNPSPSDWNDASTAVDAVRARFGSDAVAPASLVGSDGIEVKRRGDTQWGPAR